MQCCACVYGGGVCAQLPVIFGLVITEKIVLINQGIIANEVFKREEQ